MNRLSTANTLRILATSNRAALYTSKRFSTAPGPSPEPVAGATSRSSSWPWVVGGLAAAGGVAYYYMGGQEGAKVKGKEIKAQAHEADAAAKAKYQDLKAGTQKTLQDAENRGQKAYDSLKANAKETATEAQQRYEALRGSLATDVQQAEHEVEKKTQEAKAGWFGWLGGAKSKAADKVASGADDVKKAAEKRS